MNGFQCFRGSRSSVPSLSKSEPEVQNGLTIGCGIMVCCDVSLITKRHFIYYYIFFAADTPVSSQVPVPKGVGYFLVKTRHTTPPSGDLVRRIHTAPRKQRASRYRTSETRYSYNRHGIIIASLLRTQTHTRPQDKKRWLPMGTITALTR